MTLLGGCASAVTEEPTGGGMWGYLLHSHKYPERIEERAAALAAARRERDALAARLRTLQSRARQARERLIARGENRQQQKVDSLLGQLGRRQEELRVLSLDQGAAGLKRIGKEVADLEKALSAF